ncbi:Outer membrane lipoprotein carrier protein LolA [Sulfidibacter corallicola]|uniref:Outer membrane lipoprotein carrier protein LolA n=1 Tax=Sulfidibacter corallicola TaxID=2818388 RepID=A0A8A4TCB4_SULCO|nr:outer-membrane lipoprotein carrier protein LolA [Sulfidibacter corallicola]QTD47576.1 outer membrane lipoprotein carrier protein LolA [Sulfidibacter corallicola]
MHALAFFLLLIAPATVLAGSKMDPELVSLIEKIDARNAAVQTMQAEFIQRREVSLLKEPIEMKGIFYMKKDTGIKFDFDPEQDMVLVITPEEMVSLSPKAKKATRIKIKKRRSSLSQYVLMENLSTILDYFQIIRTLNAEGEETRTLILKPTKRKVKKKVSEIRLWFDESYLINKIKVVSADGDIYFLELNQIEVNKELDGDHFTTAIPEGFELGDRMEFIFGPNTGL